MQARSSLTNLFPLKISNIYWMTKGRMMQRKSASKIVRTPKWSQKKCASSSKETLKTVQSKYLQDKIKKTSRKVCFATHGEGVTPSCMPCPFNKCSKNPHDCSNNQAKNFLRCKLNKKK